MWFRRSFLLALLAVPVLAATHQQSFAQQKAAPKAAPKPAPIAPAAPLKDGWEEIDKRLVFLMVRLANVEASLDAVEKKLGVNQRQQASKAGDAKRAELGNEMMDRKGGGPVRWSQFYGRTAEKFFYHPTENHTYHTQTVLSQQSPSDDNRVGEGVPSRQGLPVHQRPPQFDYIYRANESAKARAEQEVQQLRNKLDALQARRRQLEDEQAALWCQIAFRAVSRYELTRKPVYRFEPIPASMETASRQQADAIKAAAIFVRQSLSIIDEAEKDQGKAFGSVKLIVADARNKFDDALIPLDTLTQDATNIETSIGRFCKLAGKLKDVADNLSDSYEVALDGDRFKDEVRKETFRGLLQESLVDYAQIVLALNEMAVMMAEEWKAKPDVNAPLKFVSLELPERTAEPAVPAAASEDAPVPATKPVQAAGQVGTEALQGEWFPVRSQGYGRDTTDSDWHRVASLSVNGRQFAWVMLDGVYRGELLADDSTIPKQVTFRIDTKTGNRGNATELRGIYRREGDDLTLCWIIWCPGVNELPRPTTFDTEKSEALKAKASNPTYVGSPKGGEVKYVFRRRLASDGNAERSDATSLPNKSVAETTVPKPTATRTEREANVVAVYRHIVPGRGQPELRFLSDGKIEGQNTTWKREGRKLILEWANPGDARWRDELWLSDDGSSYSGQNQGGVKIRGEAVSLSPEWSSTGQQRSEQRPSKRLSKRESNRTPTLVEIRILRNGNWVYHPISYDGGTPYITRTDGSPAKLEIDGESLSFRTINGGRFSFDLRNQKTSSGEPARFIYK